MKIELKAVKHHTSLSEETHAFSASLHIEGKRVATASNRGDGGPADIRPLEGQRDAFDKAIAFLARQSKVSLGGGLNVQPDLDLVISQLVEVDLVRQQIHRGGKRIFGPKATGTSIFRRDTNELMTYKCGPETPIRTAQGMTLGHEVVIDKEQKAGHDPVCLNTLYAQDADAAFRLLAEREDVVSTYDWTLESALAGGRF
jgi:hypothetical protein